MGVTDILLVPLGFKDNPDNHTPKIHKIQYSSTKHVYQNLYCGFPITTQLWTMHHISMYTVSI